MIGVEYLLASKMQEQRGEARVSSVFPFSFCLDGLYIGEGGLLKSATISVSGSIFDLSCIHVSFTKLGALVFKA